jgi:hypothetical protein
VLWIVLDVVIALLAVLGLGLVALRLWRQVRALTRLTGEATARVGEATAALEAVQARDA